MDASLIFCLILSVVTSVTFILFIILTKRWDNDNETEYRKLIEDDNEGNKFAGAAKDADIKISKKRKK